MGLNAFLLTLKKKKKCSPCQEGIMAIAAVPAFALVTSCFADDLGQQTLDCLLGDEKADCL